MGISIIQRYDLSRKSVNSKFDISPAYSSFSTWDLYKFPLVISAYGEYIITPRYDMTVNVKMWGAGGGTNTTRNWLGGAGGYSSGKVILFGNTPYKLFIGEGGKSSTSGGGGGGGTALVISSSLSPLIVAGAGGGQGVANTPAPAGGGLSGQDITSNYIGNGKSGTQTGPGNGGTGTYTGENGVGRNGGSASGNFNVIVAAGGRGFGIGGSCLSNNIGQAGGGGGGYYGGGGGGYGNQAVPSGSLASGGNGGSGSGYFHPTLVTNGVTQTGSYSTAANSSDSDRGTSGNSATDGKIIITL